MVEVYIGQELSDWLPAEVLRYSLSKHSTSSLTLHDLKYVPVKAPVPITTGTSLFRFYIPQLNQFKDKVIFIDSHTIVRMDIADLLNEDMQGKGALSPSFKEGNEGRYTQLMVLDCSKLTHWDGNKIATQCENRDIFKETLLGLEGGLVTQDLAPLHLESGKMTFLGQDAPWKNRSSPNNQAFLEDLRGAIEDEEITLDSLKRESEKGKVYPEIFHDLGL